MSDQDPNQAAPGAPSCAPERCPNSRCRAAGVCQQAELLKRVSRDDYGEHDAGPWHATADGRSIISEDFTHDVQLRVTGDFYSDAQRKRYADNLVAKLNAPNIAPKTAD